MTDIVKGSIDQLAVATQYFAGLLSSNEKEVREAVVKEVHEVLLPSAMSGHLFVKLGGLSGAAAVCMGAYGAHGFKDGNEKLKMTFDTGNKYHLLHSIALCTVPLTNYPMLVGTLFSSGMLLFSGSCYYHALTGNNEIRRVTPYGGFLLIAGWISVAL